MNVKYVLPLSVLVVGSAIYGQDMLQEALQVRFAQRQESSVADRQQKGALQHSQTGKVQFNVHKPVANALRVGARGNMADNLLLYGLKCMDAGADLAGAPYNVIRIHAASGTTKYDVSPEIQAGKAAFYAGGKFYTVSDADSKVTIYTYDAKTWEPLGQDEVLTLQDDYLRQAATVDPTTGEAYIMLWGQIDWTTYETHRPLYKINLETMEATLAGKVNSLFIQTMFFDMEGQLYGIPYNENKLYKIDKNTGAHEAVGDINLPFNRYPYSESACIDPATGKIYWVTPDRNDGQSYLYTLDPKTCQAELVSDMPNDEHLLGLYIPEVAAAAPAAVSGIEYADGKLTFTAPTTTYSSGAALEGELTAQAVVDGQAYTQAVKAGEAVEMAIELAEGMHSIVINVKNEAGEGAERIYDLYTGEDTPAAVTGAEASRDGNGLVTVTWNAPTASVNGGAFDDAKLRYDVVRLPDLKVVATDLAETTVTDQLPEKHDHYTYAITAKVGDKQSEAAISTEVIFGAIWVPNYTEQFRAPEDWTLFTVIDNNEDGATFLYVESQGFGMLQGNGAKSDANPDGGNGMDDYLITPAIRLEKNTEYRFRFDITELGVNEHIGVLLGTDKTIAALQTIHDFQLYWANDNTGLTCYFSVPEDGLYYLALHDDAPVYSSSFRFDNMSVDLYSRFDGPAAVTALTATAGAKGAIANTVSFTAPVKTFKGDDLTAAMTIKIEGNGQLLATLEDVQPGQQISWQDEDVTAGSQTYRVYAINAAGEGQEAIVTNWVGMDLPASPVFTDYHQNASYQPVVSWKAATETGINGGYVDPSAVTYMLCKYNPWDYSNQWTVVATTTDLTAVDDTYMSYYGQENVTYAVFPQNEVGIGDGSAFGITLGQPWDTPYSESFSYGFAWNSPWTLHAESYDYAWQIVTGSGLAVKPYDETGDDGGMLYYTWKANDSNNQWMEGPRVSLGNLSKGELSFYMYHGFEADEEDVVLEVYANYNDLGWNKIGTVDYNNGASGWTRSSFRLQAAEAPEGYGPAEVQIAFRGVTLVPSASIFVDLIKIEDGVDTDLALASITGAKRIEIGQSETLNLAVANYGMESVDNYAVNYTVTDLTDGTVITQASVSGIEALASGEVATLTVELEPTRDAAGKTFLVEATVVADGDAVEANNAAEFRFSIHGSSLPAAADLVAEDGTEGITLSWTAPAKSEITDPVSDNFDDYESFIIDEIGDWKVYDGDGCIPVYFGGPSIPHDFDAKAWQVWAPEEAGFSLEKFPMLTPHSGTKVLTSWTASDGQTTTLPTDDWLISSEVEGGTDVSFWAMMPNAGADPDNVEVLYSTTDQLPENFTAIDGDEVPSTTEWIKYEYTLPKDARYFAIRNWNNGGNATVLFMDDVEYTPLYGATTPLTFVGYRIYRDNVVIADGVQETTYVDTPEPGEHIYYVTAVWAEGESNTTNVALLEVITSLNAISAGEAESIELLNVDGTRVEGQHAKAGIYLQRQGDKVSKIVVR